MATTNTPTTIDQAADAGFPSTPVAAVSEHGEQVRPRTNPRVADRLEAYRARERKTIQLARTLGRVFTSTELAVLFDALPDGQGVPIQVLADAVGKAWGDTRPITE